MKAYFLISLKGIRWNILMANGLNANYTLIWVIFRPKRKIMKLKDGIPLWIETARCKQRHRWPSNNVQGFIQAFQSNFSRRSSCSLAALAQRPTLVSTEADALPSTKWQKFSVRTIWPTPWKSRSTELFYAPSSIMPLAAKRLFRPSSTQKRKKWCTQHFP